MTPVETRDPSVPVQENAADTTKQRGTGPTRIDLGPAGNARVLVVDDDTSVQGVMVRILERDGYEVAAAGSAEEGLGLLAISDFEAVVSDIRLPGASGTELLQRVRASTPDVPVILFTGQPDVHTAIQAVEHRAFHYLTKPFRARELLEVVGRAVAHARIARIREEAVRVTRTVVPPGAELANQFERALDTMWFAYQPIIDRNWAIVGYEALLRCEETALRGPREFLAAAETLGRVDELARLIRDRAPEALEHRPEQPLLFMNVDPSQLRGEGMFTSDDLLRRMAGRVVLEITERTSLATISNFEDKIWRLKDMGLKIAVDDLGAGYSGLTTFAQLEPEFVKLDGTLIRGAQRSERKKMIIGSMANLCVELGISVVAEGVETQEEFEVLRELGCSHFQGFFVGRPAPLS